MALGPMGRRHTSLQYDTPLHDIVCRYRAFFAQWRALALLARCNDGIGRMDLTAGIFRTIVCQYLVPPDAWVRRSSPLWPGDRAARTRGLVKRPRDYCASDN